MAQHPQGVQAAPSNDPESNSESRAAREAQLLDLLDQTSELICTSDPTGRITYANSTWLRALGYSMEEARQLRPADLVAPEHRGEYLGVARRVNRGEAVEGFEAVLIARSGQRVVCRGRASARMSNGVLVETRAVYRDVTEERRVEGMRARLAATLEATSDFVSIATRTGEIVFLNRAGHQLIGLDERASLASIRADSLHPAVELERLTAEAIPAALRNGKWEGESRMLSVSGEQIPVSMVIVAHPSVRTGDPPYFLSTVMRDLRERVRTEEVLRESEERFRSVLENLRLSAMVLDTTGHVLFANDHLLNLSGWTRDEVIGMDWFERFAPGEPERAGLFATKVASDDIPPHYEADIALKNGLRRQIEWDNVPLRSANGRLTGMASVGRDIDAERRTQKLKDQLIATVSHELRSPLSAVRGALQLLSEDVSKEGRPRKMIDMAMRNTDRVLRLTKNLLDIERVESGILHMERVPVPVAQLLDDVIEVMSYAAELASVTLQRRERPAEPSSILGDQDRLMQVLMNLVNNAIKFSAAHGSVVVDAVSDGDMIRISISDEGRGIPDDKLEAIFDRFTQVDAADAREKGGAGLGLAIARAIVEKHDGRLWAESVFGRGSTFHLTLPRA